MASENLADLLSRLSPNEKEAVREFIEFLKGRKAETQPTPFLAAIEEFMAEHPELLRRLAK